jgi:flagellar hook protein FlgE
MSLSSSLFSGISGLNALGNAMTVIGDNIANVNTVGFKGSRVTFQDVLSQSVATTAGTAQVGRGTSLADISSSFSQGSFESTDSSTDLAIGGAGFFVVRDPNDSNNEFYTRAGEFRFDKDGNFINPAGYIVRGWELDEVTGEDLGTITDIKMSSFTSSPSETDTLAMIINLDSDATNNSIGVDALANKWDGDNVDGDYIGSSDYEYQTTLKVFDSLGSTHDITVFFDPGESAAGDPVWEYIVTTNPSEDNRTIAAGFEDNTGLLAKGTVVFNNSSGQISGAVDSITCSTNNGDGTWTDLTNADANANGGYFSFSPDFIGGSPMNVNLDFGSRFNGSVWANDSLSTTQFASASTTIFQSANGYGAGDLESVTVATDGVITGQYSNGQVLPLYRVALANFQNEQGLYKVGSNLYRETRLSGDPITGKPGSNGLGSISPNSLEQSNIDIATEFVKMITTQRGFQANSKIITVTDQMLNELINLKR